MEKNEKKWDEAKNIALKGNRVRDYSYINRVYNVLVDTKSYSFNTEAFAYDIVEIKGRKRFFVTGYISNTEKDVVDDVITQKCLKSMLAQIKSQSIALDYEHEIFRDNPSILPAGKIIDAKIDDRGLWVKAELNSDSPKFKSLWGSVKNGFLKAFSIAFKTISTVTKAMNGAIVRVIDDLQLLNVALTGTPVNASATISDFSMKGVMLKAINEMNEVTNMAEDEKETPAGTEDPKGTEAPAGTETEAGKETGEEGKEVGKETPEVEPTVEQKAFSDAVAKEVAVQLKAKDKKDKEEEEEKNKKVDMKSISVDMKSMKETMEAQAAELKAIKETNVFKSATPSTPKIEEKGEKKNDSVLGMI